MPIRRYPETSGRDESAAKSYARDAIFLIAAILSILGSVALEYERLPWWYKFLSGAFILLGIVMLVEPWTTRAGARVRRHRRLKRASAEVLGVFHDLVADFRELINPNNANSLARHLEEFRAQRPEMRGVMPSPMPLAYFQDFFAMFARRLEAWKGDHGEFAALARDFYSLVNCYGRIYADEPLAAIRALPQDKFPDSERRKIRLLRETHVAFLRRYMEFARSANWRFGEDVFSNYLNVPEEV